MGALQGADSLRTYKRQQVGHAESRRGAQGRQETGLDTTEELELAASLLGRVHADDRKRQEQLLNPQ